jgi:N-acyl-D-aspartate/D-glutamate deacylase
VLSFRGKAVVRREAVFKRKFSQLFAAVLVLTASLGGLFAGCNTPESYDILIKGGTVYDGTTAEPRAADIGIKGDRIAAIGNLTGSAARVIDAAGYAVAPGFIDVHTHVDLMFLLAGDKASLASQVPEWKTNHNYLFQGVTTIVTGNCGQGYADTGKWFGILDKLKFGDNVYHLAPYGAIREELFGPDQSQPLTAPQVEAMKKRLAEEMEKGAVGLSVGLEYAPDYLATTEELIELAKVVKKYGGIYATHIRNLTGAVTGGRAGVLEAIGEAIEIGRQAGVPVQISHIQVNAPHNVRSSQLAELIEKARKEGLDITADQHPYEAGISILSYRLPKKFLSSDGVKEEYKNAAGRAEMKKAIEEVFTFLGPEKLMVSMSTVKEYQGKTVKEIADAQGKEPSQCYVDLVTMEHAPMAFFFEISDQINRELSGKDWVFTASDGFLDIGAFTPHPRSYGTFARKIRDYALDSRLLSLNDAIRSMTSLPAEKFRIKGRGRIVAGNYADITIFDLKTIKELGTYKDPAKYPIGFKYVIVNGAVSIDDGKATGNTGGRALKRD